MAQHDYSIVNAGFPATRSDINNALSAISTSNSGTSAPATQFAGQFWLDTNTPSGTTWTLYFHDGTDDITFATIDTSANTINFTDSTLEPTADTSAGDNAAIGYTAAEGLILTGQGSTNDVTIKNDTDADVISIPTGTTNVDVVGDFTAGTLNADGDTAASDNAAIGYTATEGLILTGQGSTSDVTIKNDADATVISIPTGTTNVGIGTTAPTADLHISKVAATPYIRLTRTTSATSDWSIFAASNELYFRDEAATDNRMIINSSGHLFVGKAATSYAVAGVELQNSGFIMGVRDGDVPMNLNRLTDDGIIVGIQQATVTEGTISVSGNTVSYGGFTGTHWSRFSDNSTPTILRGTVLESLDEMCDWYNLEFDVTTTTQDDDDNDVTNTVTEKIPYVLTDGQSNGDTVTYNHEGTDYQATIVKEGDVKHMMSKVSDTTDAKNVYGLFVAYDLDGEGYNDFYVASVGTFVVRIKSGETVAKGDLLQSNGDGTAKVQSDDNVKSSSFAKVLSTTIIETYDDGSFIVPCSLRC